jgi:amino acid transporter
VLIGTGLFRYFVLGLHGAAPTNNVLSTETTETLGILLILRAFAAGCTALTGVEAISNGVPAFKAPESENASRTLVIMVIILGSMFLGITYLANLYPVVPEANKETIISQLGRTAFGASWFGYLPYLFTQVSTTLILVLAANTSFADFPRLASLMSQDRFMPHAFVYVGQRLVFTTGILALSFFAGLLIFLFHASTHNLIPLYAVGVFISFTLSQAGMVRHWYHLREKNWRRNLVINAIGALATFIVLCVIIEAKFVEGAWMVVLLIPLLMGGFQLIKNHYTAYHAQVTRSQDDLVTRTNLIIVPIARMDPLTLRTLTFARTIEGEVTAVFIAKDNREHQQMEQEWQAAKLPTPLRVIDSPFRSVTGPLVNYIDHVHETHPDANIVIVVPEVVTRHFWHRFLHNQTAQLLKLILLFRPQHIVVSVPYHLEQ